MTQFVGLFERWVKVYTKNPRTTKGLMTVSPNAANRRSKDKIVKVSGKADEHVGPVLQQLRKTHGLSVRTLASKTGFTPSFISQVERRLASPSIASLDRIAAALGVTLGQFFSATGSNVPTVIKARQRHALQSAWSRAKLEALGPVGIERKLEAVMITMAPGGSSGKRPYASPTEQFAIVFDGEALLTLEEEDHQLRRGDSVTVPAKIRHRWQNCGKKVVQILLITLPRTWSDEAAKS